MAKEPVQFNPHPTEAIRKEFEAKSENVRKDLDTKAESIRKDFDTKIDGKVSNHVFYWVMGTLITIVVGSFIGLFNYIGKASDKQSSINERLIHVEAKTDRADSINDRLVRLETEVKSMRSKQ